jgi:hypothetical protein
MFFKETERPLLSHPSATTCNHGQRDSAYQLNATGNQSGCRPPQTSPCCRSAAPKRQPHAQEQRPSPEPIWCLSWIALDPDMWHDRGTPWGGVGNECRENHWPRGPTMRIPSQSTRNPGWRFSPPCCPARPSVLPSETLRVAQRDPPCCPARLGTDTFLVAFDHLLDPNHSARSHAST